MTRLLASIYCWFTSHDWEYRPKYTMGDTRDNWHEWTRNRARWCVRCKREIGSGE